jgi:hypothetical protein
MAPVDAEPALVRLPFPLPPRFLEAIGYRGGFGVVGLCCARGAPGAGDELYVYDPRTASAGLHDHWPYLDLVRQPGVAHWLDEHLIELGSLDVEPTHHLVVLGDRNEAYVAPAALARAVVARQRFDPGDFFAERSR